MIKTYSKLIKNIGPTKTSAANTKNKVRSPSEHGKFLKSGIHLLHVGSKREILNRFQHISAKSSKKYMKMVSNSYLEFWPSQGPKNPTVPQNAPKMTGES